MLKRGDKPGPEHYAALGLSMLPVIGPAAVRAATPLVLAFKKSVQDWGKRMYKNVDFDIDQHMTATTDTTWKATGFRETKKGKILESLGMLPGYKDLNKPIDPMLEGWYNDYVLKGKEIGQKIFKDMELSTRPGPQTKEQMLEKLKSEFPDSWEKITKAKLSKVLELSADEFYVMNPQMQSRLLETAGYSKQDLDVYHWVSEARDMQVAMHQLARELGDENSPLVNEIALSIKQKDLAVFEKQLDTHAEIFNALERLHPDKFAEFVQRNNELYTATYAYPVPPASPALTTTKKETSEELNALVNEIRQGRYPSFDETMKLSDAGWSTDEISQLLDESIKGSSLTDFLASPKLPSKSDILPENVTQLPGTKPIQDMTWREWDDLSDAPFKLSSKQNEMMKAQGITDPEDVLDHFWAKGARDDFVGWLEEAIAKTGQDFPEELEFVRLRDLKSGYVQTMTDKQFKNDIAWKEIEIEAQKIAGTDPMIVAEKMAFKPDKVTHAEWAELTKELSREETINLARRMTLRLID